MLTPEEQARALRELASPEERAELDAADAREAAEKAAQEAADADKPRRGRKPGVPNKPKVSDAFVQAGCVSLVRFVWWVSYGFSKLVGGTLAPLTEAEEKEGAAELEPTVRRYAWLVALLTVVGFPLWFMRMVGSKFAFKQKPQLQALPEPTQIPRGNVKQ